MEENPQKTIGKDEIQKDQENVEYRPVKKKSVQQIDLGNDYFMKKQGNRLFFSYIRLLNFSLNCIIRETWYWIFRNEIKQIQKILAC